VWGAAALTAWLVFAASSTVTFLSRRLNYRLRWYIVTDRSLRIRTGVFTVNELTMTYGNIQEIRVSAGPLQHVLGLADVEVHSAGGGGASRGDSGHIGRFEGLSNANAVRDLMVERLRHYRDSGLGGDPAHSRVDADAAEIAAAKAMLDEARALRTALAALSDSL
jgi:membrane protein YdbS with pleckstrin-like domain